MISVPEKGSMKELIGTISRHDLGKKRGHQPHISGTGIHKDKKRYNRKVKHKEEFYEQDAGRSTY